MTSRSLAAGSALVLLIAVVAVAAAVTGDTINKTCPVSGETVDPRMVVEHDGHQIGLCCGGCRRKFDAWDDARKDAYVTTSLAAFSDTQSAKTGQTQPRKGDPYMLAKCPVSGQPLGSMGDPVIRTYGGREIRFCCEACIERFDRKKDGYITKIDAELIKQQRPYFPLTTCVVMGDELVDEGDDAAIDYVHRNRLVRLCCKGCMRKLKKDPTEYLKKIDEAIIAQQRDAYPLEQCVVGGGRLGSMGEPVEIIVGNRLVRFCCKGCVPQFEKEPSRYLTMIDNAWKTKGGVKKQAMSQ